MPKPALLRLVPGTSHALHAILDPGRGVLQPPIRSEIFGPQRFAQHGRSLGDTHRAARATWYAATFFPRLRSNMRALREAHRYIGGQAATGYDISPAAEWLLDNFHVIEAQLEEIHAGLPRSYFRALPVLVDEPLAGLPRVYGVAWAFVAHTDGAFDEDLLIQFLGAYQETRELSLGELWALPTTLRVVLIENLRRLAERVAAHKAARELANLCCDRIEACTVPALDDLLVRLGRRGVGRVFLAQMTLRLQDRRTTGHGNILDWLRHALPDPAAVHAQQAADQAADNLSVSSAVTSLRAIGDADWPEIIGRTSVLMQRMLSSPVFAAEHVATRDRTLHAIERLARQAACSEVSVAQALLDRMHAPDPAEDVATVAGHWLDGGGRPVLMRALGLGASAALPWRAIARRVAVPAYLGAMLLGTAALVGWLMTAHRAGLVADMPTWFMVLGAVLMAFPASEAVVAVVNRLISESARPDHLPRFALANGIPPEHRVIVAIPAMLTGHASTHELTHRLELHHLANPERHAQFALLTDWADADTARALADDTLLADALHRIRTLNARHPALPGDAPRFVLLHRARRFSESEQRWIGWERKRGKLEQLVDALATGKTGAFLDLGDTSRLAAGTRYIVTLDSDTGLPPGRLRDLVGVAAHPHNQPRFAADGRYIVGGYGILQPRVVTPLPAPRDFTPYHWLFAGQCGIDPYSAATSEVYQDLFAAGSFTGKGLLDVHAMHAVLSGRLPEGRVLSHDLLEGAIARCAAVTDITVIEDAPFHADVAASRVHRWTRGDWQLLPFLLRPRRYHLRAIDRWKMWDNLRRSLVAPMSLALLLLALSGFVVSPVAALALVLAAFSAGPLLGAVAGFSPSRADIAKRHFYRQAVTDLLRAIAGGVWLLGQLLQQALMAVDAIVRALWRMTVSHRLLLQWTTAATAQASAQTAFAAVMRRHRTEPVVALLLGALLLATTPHPEFALALCLLWSMSPIATWWVSRSRPALADAALPTRDHDHLAGIARDTWRYFERCVTAADNHLPPDNLQVLPADAIAHRTSPTNIGLYLLSVAAARAFGWIGTEDLLARLEATSATLAGMQRHRGHFLNWYDTQTCAPLLPMYVSTVDSGNLSGHLLAVARACIERVGAPHDPAAGRRAIEASRHRLAPMLLRPPLLPAASALERLAALPDPVAHGRRDPDAFECLLREAAGELATLLAVDPEPAVPAPSTPRDELAWCLADHVATVRSAWSDAQALAFTGPLPASADAGQRLERLARDFQRLAWDADFAFLYHRKRHLLHIGFRVAEQQLDAGFYDLLASESRLTSLLAIAKGDVPVSHWSTLGRPFYALGADTGLRSWSGSMFEYLMPSLVLDEPHGSVLRDACRAALREQMDFATAQEVPWGISESAHAGRDHTLAYQYAPQGVPRSGLRRAPPDELVVAPYATALAAQIDPLASAANFTVLEKLSARGRYGFIEALDFSPGRQVGGDVFTPVGTFMAHHQGMSIVALANVLLDGVARRWGMADPHVEAMVSLLHERAPREVSMLYEPPSGPPLQALRRRAPALLRDVVPGASAVEPTHLLSNGRYGVTLRANGAGRSQWGSLVITRSRDDALRDAFGAFFYMRRTGGDDERARPVSITQHPAPDPVARYRTTWHADRVCFDTTWPDLETHMTVWVSPEDDIEFRQVEVRNLGDLPLDIELLSAFEPTLADPRADEAHPAFTNFFVRAEWQAAQQALVFERTPRLPTEQGLHAAHFLAETDPQVVEIRGQTDRQRWLGRNRDAMAPLADLDVLAVTSGNSAVALDTGLDPVCVLAVRLRIAPNSKAQLTFATAASDSDSVLRAVIDKYRHAGHVQRASLMSATLTGIRLHALRIAADSFAAAQTLTTALVLTLTRVRVLPVHADGGATDVCDRRLLWRFGISGDRPVILVSAGAIHGIGMLRSLAQAMRLWSWGGVACDLVVVNAEPASYDMPLHREIAALRERHVADCGAQVGGVANGFHLLRADEVSNDELATLQHLARVRLRADGRPLAVQVDQWRGLQERVVPRRASERRRDRATVLGQPSTRDLEATPSKGAFAPVTGEFRFDVDAGTRPARPWINVLSNPAFGAQLSEAGGGFTWAVNSRSNQLTAWSNDPVSDPPSESFLVQDCRSGDAWNIAPAAGCDDRTVHHVSHGQGFSAIRHRRGAVDVTATWCVDPVTAVKQVHLRIANRGRATLRLRLIGVVEWIMGATRTDRGTVFTAFHREVVPPSVDTPGIAPPREVSVLTSTQRERSAGFGGGTAFLAVAGPANETEDWSCDRRECFDRQGRFVLPDRFGRHAGGGLDPCAALSVFVELDAGESTDRVFLLGYADTPSAALHLAKLAAAVPAARRMDQVRNTWDRLLDATTVKTPDPLFDVMVNRWLLYQTVSCRLWAKAGFYQAGGATGFRDQLQDSMALAWAAPQMLRAQILLCASRQFPEGDVQHWWHAPTGAGVRTHFSDDLLWLAHACVHYLRMTGDMALLDARVPFIDGAAIPEGAEDAYYTPAVASEDATVYEHAARAIDRSLRTGSHGLPLMGTGDWNDGMNRVGHAGRGESVWLGWFLCRLVADFAPLAQERGDDARALRWTRAAEGWKAALLGAGWDGLWFRRAYFDDGQPLGTKDNPEARIDLIAQAWAVLSKAAPPAMQQMAMTAVEAHLVDHDAGLIRLLDPPLVRARPSAGYIQAYPPGIRENGGQYSHAGVWALMAQADLARAPGGTAEDADVAYRSFTWLSPAHRASHPVQGAAYLVEPYVMAGDVYTQPPYVGRGGWSWYTGAAAWLHRAAIESIFGLRQGPRALSFVPCLPSHWHRAELTLRRDDRTMHFILIRATPDAAIEATARWGARLLRVGEQLAWTGLASHSCFVIPLPDPVPAAG